MPTVLISSEPQAIERCVILTGAWDFGVRRHAGELADAYPEIEWFVLRHRPRRPVWRIIRSQIRNLRRHGWRWIPYRIARAVDALHDRLAPEQSGTGRPGSRYGEAAIRARPNVHVHEVANINGSEIGQRIRDWRIDLGIAVSAPILRPHVFEAPRLGSLNIHRGRIPDYRGMPVAFWELHDGADTVGATIHRVVEKLDAGEILLEETVPVPRFATVRGMQIVLQDVGIRMIVRALDLVRSGTAQWKTPEGVGRVRRRPPLALEAELNRQLRREGSTAARAGRFLRAFVLGARNRLFGVPVRLAQGLIGRQPVVVLLYHRVNDDMRDELTTGIEQFDRHLEWLGRHCRVVSIEDVIDDRVDRRSRRPLVAITFDDGYRDNAVNAAPILERHGFPAAFFVSTGIIGTTRPFPHDVNRGAGTRPAMDWRQVRDLRERGFTIGSHTETHIDCGREPFEAVRRELAGSMNALQRELGLERILFAYPYGRRDNITPEVRDAVRDLGYAACLSAYGGANGRIDRFDVRRKGIHHDFGLEGLSGRIHGRG